MMKKTTRSDLYHNRDILHTICNSLADRLGEYLHHLGLQLRDTGGKCFTGKCPVHGGGGIDTVQVYKVGHSIAGNWQCQSHHCERSDDFGRSILKFTQGVLSHDQFGWKETGDQTVPFRKAVDLACDFLSLDIEHIVVDDSIQHATRLARDVDCLVPVKSRTKILCDKKQLHKMIKVPSAYFLGRGYKKETLVDYEVGTVTSKKSEHYGRVLVPVYNKDHSIIIGAISRSTKPKCDDCGLCHNEEEGCPDTADSRLPYLRWRVVKTFKDKQHLYNGWNAKKYVKQRNDSLIVVEGVGDVWRMVEAGIPNVVALFGSSSSDQQRYAMLEMGTRKVIALTDNDPAGEIVAQQLAKEIMFADVYRVRPTKGHKDVGEMTVEEIHSSIVPAINSIICPPTNWAKG